MLLLSRSLTKTVRHSIIRHISCCCNYICDGLVSADLFVGLQRTKVEVYENEGPARVCAFIQGDCYPSSLFHIRIFTEDDSAGMNG